MVIKKLKIQDILNIISGELVKGDQQVELSVPNPDSIYFAFSSQIQPVHCLVTNKYFDYPEAPNIIKVNNPRLAFAKLLAHLAKTNHKFGTIEESAKIAKSSEISKNAYIGHNVVIQENAKIADGCVINDNVVIMANVSVGSNSQIMPNTTCYPDTIIGNNVLIHANSVIGADGFGFERTDSGDWFKICHVGRVRIGNNVEIGAGVTIDRGTINETIISDGVKIDNGCQIAHNVQIGRNCVISGCSGIAGSTRIGDNVILGGRVAVSDHLNIAANVIVKGASTVLRDIKQPGVYGSAINVLPSALWNKCMLILAKLPLIYKFLIKSEVK